MKYFFKFIYFFLLSFIKSKRFIILNPNLSLLGIRKVYLYDKQNKSILNFEIRNKYDLITIEEIFFYECYKLSNIDNYSKIKRSKTKKMQIHDFLDFIIRKGVKVNTSDISGKYMEIDTFNDFKLAKKMFEIS